MATWLLKTEPDTFSWDHQVKKGAKELLVTQCYIKGEPTNDRDGVYRGIRDPVDRELVCTDFKPVKESKVGELSASFDIVVGRTPVDADDHAH